MKTTLTILATAALLFAADKATSTTAETAVQSETKTELVQKTCPVMGGTIDSTLFVEHEGQKVYFCCAGCKPAFEKEPAKYIAKIHEEMGADLKESHDHSKH